MTGYDLPRLAGGSFGGIGLIGRVCLKLWPVPAGAATVTLPGPRADYGYRPLAVIEERDRVLVFLAGTPAEVEARAAELGGARSDGWRWPDPPAGEFRCSLRIVPRMLGEAVERLPVDWQYQALPGVGEIRIGAPSVEQEIFAELRSWVEHHGGSLVIAAAPEHVYEEVDPWGMPPASLELQRRMVERFDPDRVVNPGRLPGGL